MRPAPDTLELGPQEIAQRKEKAEYRLNVIQFPVLRLFGFVLISSFMLAQNRTRAPCWKHNATVF